jgi:SAM-dependent methyltransferase
MTVEPTRHENYLHGHAAPVVAHHARRTAAEAAAFLLPSLAPNMRLLDVGCGPGSITVGLAEHLAQGEVIGVDLSEATLAQAAAEAAARGLTNLHYQPASVYELPFEDNSFDVAYAHQVFQHLSKRREALAEVLRVVKPGGLIAIRDVDWGTAAYWPPEPLLARFLEVYQQTARVQRGEPNMGRRLRALFVEAGLTDVEVTASVWCYTTEETTTTWGDTYAERLETSTIGQLAVDSGFATRAEIEEIAAGFRVWARKPDATWMFTHCAALARKPA